MNVVYQLECTNAPQKYPNEIGLRLFMRFRDKLRYKIKIKY